MGWDEGPRPSSPCTPALPLISLTRKDRCRPGIEALLEMPPALNELAQAAQEHQLLLRPPPEHVPPHRNHLGPLLGRLKHNRTHIQSVKSPCFTRLQSRKGSLWPQQQGHRMQPVDSEARATQGFTFASILATSAWCIGRWSSAERSGRPLTMLNICSYTVGPKGCCPPVKQKCRRHPSRNTSRRLWYFPSACGTDSN